MGIIALGDIFVVSLCDSFVSEGRITQQPNVTFGQVVDGRTVSVFNGELVNGHCVSELTAEEKDRLCISDDVCLYRQTSPIFPLDSSTTYYILLSCEM